MGSKHRADGEEHGMKGRASGGSGPFSENQTKKRKIPPNNPTPYVVTQDLSQDLGSLGERGHQYGIITGVFFLTLVLQVKG